MSDYDEVIRELKNLCEKVTEANALGREALPVLRQLVQVTISATENDDPVQIKPKRASDNLEILRKSVRDNRPRYENVAVHGKFNASDDVTTTVQLLRKEDSAVYPFLEIVDFKVEGSKLDLEIRVNNKLEVVPDNPDDPRNSITVGQKIILRVDQSNSTHPRAEALHFVVTDPAGNY